MHRIPDFIRGARVHFTFDHRTIEAYENESLASAILASKHNVLSRSIRYHRSRTVFCSTGECGWCAVEVNGESNIGACLRKCADGLTVQSQNAWPSAEMDIFSLLNMVRFSLTNTFYHRLFLYPKFLRQFYLRCIRLFTGVGRVQSKPLPQTRRTVANIHSPVVVIGNGLTGIGAAVTVAERGEHVILIDRGEAISKRKDDVGISPALLELIDKIKTLPQLEYWSNSNCVGLYENHTLGVITPDKLVTLHAKQIIFAVGALDAIPLFAGNDLPGIISARLAERLILKEGIAPGKKAVVWSVLGQSQSITSMLQHAGIEIVHQLQPEESIIEAKGGKQLYAVIIREADGRSRSMACDSLMIDALQPRNELLTQVGGQLQWDESTNGLVAMRDATLQTSVKGVRVVGEAAGCFMDENRCLVEARLAGFSALQDLGFDGIQDEINRLKEFSHTKRFDSINFPANSLNGVGYICFCEDVMEREIKLQMQDGYQSPELIKRRTAIFTGPCQGKYCRANAMRVYGVDVGATTARPPATPIRMKDLLSD